MKKLFSILVVFILVLSLLAGCASNALPLPEGMDSETVKDKALKVMDVVNAQEYETLVGMFRQDLQENLTAEALGGQLDAVWEALGAYQETTKVEVMGYDMGDGSGDVCALALVTCKYENGSKVWAVSFDTDYELIGVVIAA